LLGGISQIRLAVLPADDVPTAVVSLAWWRQALRWRRSLFPSPGRPGTDREAARTGPLASELCCA